MISPSLLKPARAPGESFPAYRRRRAAGNRAVKLHLKGRWAHVSSEPVIVEDTFDYRMRVLDGSIVRPTYYTAVNGDKMIAGQTRGVTYRKPK